MELLSNKNNDIWAKERLTICLKTQNILFRGKIIILIIINSAKDNALLFFKSVFKRTLLSYWVLHVTTYDIITNQRILFSKSILQKFNPKCNLCEIKILIVLL